MAAPLGAGGVTLLPYFDGERTPNRPKATGVFTGIRSDATREQIARAAVEGVACGLLDGLDALRAHVPELRRVMLVGGGSRSTAAVQAFADLCDLDVVVADADQAVAAGAAVQAAAVLQKIDPSEVARRWGLGATRAALRSESVTADVAQAVRARYHELSARMA
jgi:xylulokinase